MDSANLKTIFEHIYITILAHGLQGYQLDCSNTSETSNCTLVKILTNGAPINGEITDFLVKGDYMFVTQHNEVGFYKKKH